MDGRAVLRAPEHDLTLRREGLVAVPFLAPDEVDRLVERFDATVPPGETGVQADHLREDRALVRRLAEGALAVLGPKVDEAFVDHDPVLVSFIVKHPGPDTAFYLHRDIAVHDPRHTATYTIWIPLVDVGPALPNGGLGVIPGSHLLPTGEYGYEASVLIDPFRHALLDLVVPLEVAAGTALVYDSRLLHGSGPNLDTTTRFALGCALARRSEPMTHIVPTGRRRRVLHAIDRTFFFDHVPAEVVLGGMPTNCPAVDRFEDDDELSGATVAEVLGLAAPLQARVPVPGHLLGPGGEELAPLARRRAGGPVSDRDVELQAGALPPAGTELVGGTIADRQGDIGRLALVHRGRRTASPPPEIEALAGGHRRLGTRDLDLLVLDPRSWLTFHADGGRASVVEVLVLDGPRVRAGARTATSACQLDPGWSVPVPPGEPLTVWNEGPGPLVVLVRRSLSLRRSRATSG